MKRNLRSFFTKSPKSEPAQVAPFALSANKTVETIITQADGKIIVGGSFTKFCGQNSTGIARLNPDGTLDTEFNPTLKGSIQVLALQEDGKILVGGFFNERTTIARLNSDGSIDTSFGIELGFTKIGITSPPAYIKSLVLRNDGKIVVTGNFNSVERVGDRLFDVRKHPYIACLNPDGTPEDSFKQRQGLAWVITPEQDTLNAVGSYNLCLPVHTIAIQADNKMVLGGCFVGLADQSSINIGRLNADGSADTVFRAKTNDYVKSIAIQDDGKILVGGDFKKINDRSHEYLARLNPNGNLDTNFYYHGKEPVKAVFSQKDGKIIVINGISLAVQSFNPTGNIDSAFKLITNNNINTLSIQDNGSILIGGKFTSVDRQKCERIAWLNPDGTLYTGIQNGAEQSEETPPLQAEEAGTLSIASESLELTQEEREILSLLAEDISNMEIADRLNISSIQVSKIRHGLMRKFGVDNLTDLVKQASQTGFLPEN